MNQVDKNKKANEKWVKNRPKHERTPAQAAWVKEYKRRYCNANDFTNKLRDERES